MSGRLGVGISDFGVDFSELGVGLRDECDCLDARQRLIEAPLELVVDELEGFADDELEGVADDKLEGVADDLERAAGPLE
ncbi:MAG: hypothetical protein Q9220_007514 [cf. Caloplaca sp. 1 TL-2023]